MRITTWELTTRGGTGAGWLMVRHDERVETYTDPNDPPNTVRTTTIKDATTFEAFTTLAHARRAIADTLRLDKRVRLVKVNDWHYTYKHNQA
jgi:uncharacterized protein (DUF608 family)